MSLHAEIFYRDLRKNFPTVILLRAVYRALLRGPCKEFSYTDLAERHPTEIFYIQRRCVKISFNDLTKRPCLGSFSKDLIQSSLTVILPREGLCDLVRRLPVEIFHGASLKTYNDLAKWSSIELFYVLQYEHKWVLYGLWTSPYGRTETSYRVKTQHGLG